MAAHERAFLGRIRRGRPKKANARRRATTLAGRRAPDDLRSPELIKRKARATNGSPVAIELIDTAGILLAHGLIEDTELATLRMLANWLHQCQISPATSGGISLPHAAGENSVRRYPGQQPQSAAFSFTQGDTNARARTGFTPP